MNTTIYHFILILKLIIILSLTKRSESFNCQLQTKCPNTTITDDLNIEAVYMPLQRYFITTAWNSDIFPKLTPKVKHLKNLILNVLNTDSQKFLYCLFQFSVWSTGFLSGLETYPSLCNTAHVINASVNYINNNNGKAASRASLKIASLPYRLQTMMTYSSLNALKCHIVPPINLIQERCYRGGTEYEIEEAFNLFGKILPCAFKKVIFELYESDYYVDNLFANMFVFTLTPLQKDLFVLHQQNIILESFNFLFENDVSPCCCHNRLKRMLFLGKLHNETIYKNSIFLIKNKYLAEDDY